MRNTIKKVMINLVLPLSICIFACVSDNEPAYTSFGIYLVEDGSLVLSDEDIGAYIKAEHALELNQQGFLKWNSHIHYDSNQTPPTPGLSGSLYQKEFIVKLDNDVMYAGKFWSMVSSLSCSSIVILDAIVSCDSAHTSIAIQNGYAAHPLSDLRENRRIFNFFSSKGKLM
jgi:hypothetical protein